MDNCRYQPRENFGAGLESAWDKKLNRPVLMEPGRGDLAVRAVLLAGIYHRHILRALDYLPGAGRDHIVFEASRGGTLAQAAPSAPVKYRVGWAIQACYALECLQRRGLGPGPLRLDRVFLDGDDQIKLLPGGASSAGDLLSFGGFLEDLFSAGGKRVPPRIAKIIQGCHEGRWSIGEMQHLLQKAASPQKPDPMRIIQAVGVGLIGCLLPEAGWVEPVAGSVLAWLDVRVGLGLMLPWGVWTIARVDPGAGTCLAASLLLAFPHVVGKRSRLTLLLCLAPVFFWLGMGYVPGWLAGWLWGPIPGALVGGGGYWLHLILNQLDKAPLWPRLGALLLETLARRQKLLAASMAAGAVGLVRGRPWGLVLVLGLMILLEVRWPGLWDVLQLPGSGLILLLWQVKHRQMAPDLPE